MVHEGWREDAGNVPSEIQHNWLSLDNNVLLDLNFFAHNVK